LELTMALAIGTRLGAYEITGMLGVGGMGEVYRATDTNLKRDVAIKILPRAFAGDADRIARFQREAEALAALNHPNIAQIYGLERSSETTALAIELVEGPTLADRIAAGPIPAAESLNIAMQIADALEAAHAQNIVHRDLKPGNVKLRPDGTVKVLDFGIATAPESRRATSGHSPTPLTPALTEQGVLLGTAAYMSPEQARGRAVDQRADIWAFGCVLYEMLTGQQAFGGEDVTTTLARVLERPASFDSLPKDLPTAVRQTLVLCLRKDPRARIRDIGDVRLALGGEFAPDGAGVQGGPERAKSVRRRALPLVAAALVAAAFAAAATWTLKPPPSEGPKPVMRWAQPLPDGARLPGFQTVAISRDGQRVLYATNRGLYLRTVDSLDAHVISGTAGDIIQSEVFSPDGEWIAFAEGRQLRQTATGVEVITQVRKISTAGGSAVTLASVATPLGMSWESDGRILYGAQDGVWQISANGSQPQRLFATDDFAYFPQLLPGGDWVLYTSVVPNRNRVGLITSATVVLHSISSGERRELAAGGPARYVPSGHIVYWNGGTLYAIPFDKQKFAAESGPTPVLEGVGGPQIQWDVSAAGNLVYVPGTVTAGDERPGLATENRAGELTPLNHARANYVTVRASPDGKRLAFDTDDGQEAIVWVQDASGASAPQRLTFKGNNRRPVWSPDGQRVAYQSDRDGVPAIYVQRVDGVGGAQRLTMPTKGETPYPESWSPDGKYLSFSVMSGERFTLWILSLDDGSASRFSTVESVEPPASAFSADGKWLAYHDLPSKGVQASINSGVFVEPFPATGARYQAPKVQVDFQPVWSRTGLELFYVPSVAGQQLAAVNVTTGSGLSFSAPTLTPFTLTGTCCSDHSRAFDALPNDDFVGPAIPGQAATPQREIQFVANWLEEVKQLAPAK
jgi:Tol biopolymer transport system component